MFTKLLPAVVVGFLVAAVPSHAFVGSSQIDSAYNRYESARTAVSKELSKRNREDLRDLQASFQEANAAVHSMETFLAAYAIYKANLQRDASTADDVASQVLDILSGKIANGGTAGIPTAPSRLNSKEPVLSPKAAMQGMQNALDQTDAVYTRMARAKEALLKDVAADSDAVVAISTSMEKVSTMSRALEDLRVLLDEKVESVKTEIGRNEVEAGQVFKRLEKAVAKLMEAKQLIAESKKILEDAADNSGDNRKGH